MRQIALGLLSSVLLATPALAQGPVNKLNLRTDRALEGLSFVTPVKPTLSLTPAIAQDAAADPKVTVAVGADFPSIYFFRGIRQEGDPKVTFQPFVDVGVAASEDVKLNFGTWNSIHSGSTKDLYGAFYESDLYAAVTVKNIKTTYTAYTSPADAFNTVHELMFSTSFDDSASAFPLAPAVALAFELGDFGADGGDSKGIYLELGVTPAIPLADDAPVAITIPVKIGLSLKDYYQDGDDDSTFGYFSIGGNVSVPVNDYLEVHGGVSVLAFPDNILKAFNEGKSSKVIGSVGFGISF